MTKLNVDDIKSFAAAGGVPTLSEWLEMDTEARETFYLARIHTVLEQAFWMAAGVLELGVIREAQAALMSGDGERRQLVLDGIADRLASKIKKGIVL